MRKPRNRQYLTNLATTIIQQLRVPDDYVSRGAQYVYGDFSDRIKAKIRGWTPETLGKIVDFGKAFPGSSGEGKTSLYEVHCGSYCGKYWSGRELLIELACTAIVAEMEDIFHERMQEEDALLSQFLQEETDRDSRFRLGLVGLGLSGDWLGK